MRASGTGGIFPATTWSTRTQHRDEPQKSATASKPRYPEITGGNEFNRSQMPPHRRIFTVPIPTHSATGEQRVTAKRNSSFQLAQRWHGLPCQRQREKSGTKNLPRRAAQCRRVKFQIHPTTAPASTQLQTKAPKGNGAKSGERFRPSNRPLPKMKESPVNRGDLESRTSTQVPREGIGKTPPNKTV